MNEGSAKFVPSVIASRVVISRYVVVASLFADSSNTELAVSDSWKATVGSALAPNRANLGSTLHSSFATLIRTAALEGCGSIISTLEFGKTCLKERVQSPT